MDYPLAPVRLTDTLGLKFLRPARAGYVFRTNVSGRFEIVTGNLGNVTEHFGSVIEWTERRIDVAHGINRAGYLHRRLSILDSAASRKKSP